MPDGTHDADLFKAAWRKSSRSNGTGGACVEVRSSQSGVIAVRDSKNPHGPVLFFTKAEWLRFLENVKSSPSGISALAQ